MKYCVTCSGLVLLGCVSRADVMLWGGRATPEGSVLSCGANGMIFEDEFGVQRTVRWDLVRTVTGEEASKAGAYMELARTAWRARTRLERGDAVSAEPLFEELYPLYEGQSGEMAALVAEGLMRCRLRRSAQTSAVRPWLAYLVSKPTGPYRSVIAGALRSACDEQTGLVASLPPVWEPTAGVQAFARGGELVGWSNEGGELPRRAEVLSALYAHAARFECGLEESGPSIELTSADLRDQGIVLVHAMVMSRTGDAEQRAAARAQLTEMMGVAGKDRAWVEAWCRVGIGRSLLREQDSEQKRLGVVQLLHVPARFSDSLPYLAGQALAESAVAMEGLGDAAGARSLLLELREQYGSHAVLSWEPIRTQLDKLGTVAASDALTMEKR